MSGLWTVLKKELRDSARDRRSVLSALLLGFCAAGPAGAADTTDSQEGLAWLKKMASASRESAAMGVIWTTIRWPVARDRPSKNSDTRVLHRTGPSSQRSFSPLIRLQAKRPSLAKRSQSGRSEPLRRPLPPARDVASPGRGTRSARYENTK